MTNSGSIAHTHTHAHATTLFHSLRELIAHGGFPPAADTAHPATLHTGEGRWEGTRERPPPAPKKLPSCLREWRQKTTARPTQPRPRGGGSRWCGDNAQTNTQTRPAAFAKRNAARSAPNNNNNNNNNEKHTP